MSECIDDYAPGQPKRRSLLMIALLIGLLFGMLATLSIVLFRMSCARRSRDGFSRAYYKAATTQDSDVL